MRWSEEKNETLQSVTVTPYSLASAPSRGSHDAMLGRIFGGSPSYLQLQNLTIYINVRNNNIQAGGRIRL